MTLDSALCLLITLAFFACVVRALTPRKCEICRRKVMFGTEYHEPGCDFWEYPPEGYHYSLHRDCATETALRQLRIS